MSEFHVSTGSGEGACPIFALDKDSLGPWLDGQGSKARAWAGANGFEADPGTHLLVPGAGGAAGAVLWGAGVPANGHDDPFAFGRLAGLLPPGDYAYRGPAARAEQAALGWALEAYKFTRYQKPGREAPVLVLPGPVDLARIRRIAAGCYLARDLINTPANDMGPDELEQAARDLAAAHDGAALKVVSGDEGLARDFPLIQAVGMGSRRRPRLLDLSWGDEGAPKVTLVGKGVCFDSGGLNLKPGSAMALMKKDMGGAANALGLAAMIMAAGLPVRLRVLIPAVENSVSGIAFRPGDVFPSRKGLSVEIGNTDAEGRLVLADALALADEETPDLLFCLATLTGAARVALGPDLPPYYTRDDSLAAEVATAAAGANDPLWRMPLWGPYDDWLKSPIADVNHITAQPFAGSVTAALFLHRFVEKETNFAHFDIFGWMPEPRPGSPKGGAAQAIRALYDLLERRFPPPAA